ncbi:hypothetical protein L218DRAFT_1003872 [Marasmius fiardii PR-910]|nr:hypothetical protein L218DRAFT_1003872 [Marasmius fiardii PR-910]
MVPLSNSGPARNPVKSRPFPINRLPPEILREILSKFRGPTYLLNPKLLIPQEEVDVGMTPTISLVCSRWRDTVLLLPNLWSWIVFGYHHAALWNEKQGERFLRRTRRILSRVRGFPLKIDIVCCEESERYPSILGPVLEEICRTSGQWVELTFRASSFWFLHHPMFDLASFSNLTSVSFDIPPGPSAAIIRIPEIFRRCPALCSFHFSPFLSLDPPLLWPLTQKGAPRDQDIDTLPDPSIPEDLPQDLHELSNTVSLELNLTSRFIDREHNQGVGNYTAPNIRHLSLYLDQELQGCAFLFQRVSFPVLSSLELSFRGDWAPPSPQNIEPLSYPLTTSKFLTSLSLTCLHLSSRQWSNLLIYVPMLETLRITEDNNLDARHPLGGCESTRKLFEKLVIRHVLVNDNTLNFTLEGFSARTSATHSTLAPPSTKPLLPKLQNLILNVQMHSLDVDGLYEVVRSRCYYRPRLAGASDKSTPFSPDPEPNDYQHLRSLEINFHPRPIWCDDEVCFRCLSRIRRNLAGLELLRDFELGVTVRVPPRGSHVVTVTTDVEMNKIV